MNIKLIAIGKTDNQNLQSLISIYSSRISAYISFSTEIIPDIKNSKNLSPNEQKIKEGKLILSKISPSDHLSLLDENGQQFSSPLFADYIQKKLNASTKTLIFLIGGPYGFSQDVYSRANSKISLSQMTFSHQMVRLIFTEQLYRAFSILNNEPYHHQ